ncbi:MAG: glycoside hydrolase family 3 N-terminal domain-containing protein, partial [Halanaerobiales bacterium]
MKIDKVRAELSLEQKVKLLSGRDFWYTKELIDPGVPSITVSDGPHGLRLAMLEEVETESTVTYPVEAAMAATWNKELVEEIGRCIGEEAQYFNVGVLLAPGTNGKRSPAGGRNFEYFSEDPYLSGMMATAYVRGVQSQGVGTSLKHFVANEQETNRMVVSSEVDERTLREIYLRPFEMVVKNEEPWTIMCSYNKVNGTYMSQNKKYLSDVLRGEWGFSGLVVSDWAAVDSRPLGINAGLDLEMPGPGWQDRKVIEAVRRGEVSEKALGARVKNLLKLVEKVQKNQQQVADCDFAAHHQVARRAAAEAVVLLKNDGDILPLSPDMDIAVVGKFAEEPRFQGGGSSHIIPNRLERPLEEIEKYTSVEYAAAYGDDSSVGDALAVADGKDVVIVFIGTTEEMESEGYDRKNIELPPE